MELFLLVKKPRFAWVTPQPDGKFQVRTGSDRTTRNALTIVMLRRHIPSYKNLDGLSKKTAEQIVAEVLRVREEIQ